MPRTRTPTSSESDSSHNSDTDVGDQFEDLTLRGDTRPDSGLTTRSTLRYRSWQHGNGVVHVVVGRGRDSQHTFTFHGDLIASASAYFKRVLNPLPLEPTPTISLLNECPTSFEVIYQWLYAGSLKEESFYDFTGPADVFWLRAFKTAIFLSLHDLAAQIYDKFITEIFDSDNDFEPSEAFIHELYLPNQPKSINQLKGFIVAQTAYTMLEDGDDDEDDEESSWSQASWNFIFALQPEFSLKVLQRMSGLRAKDPAWPRKPATEMSRFKTYGSYTQGRD